MATPLIGPLLLLPLLLHWTADAEPAGAACAGRPADSAASADPGSRGSRALGLDRFRGGGRESFVAGEKKITPPQFDWTRTSLVGTGGRITLFVNKPGLIELARP